VLNQMKANKLIQESLVSSKV